MLGTIEEGGNKKDKQNRLGNQLFYTITFLKSCCFCIFLRSQDSSSHNSLCTFDGCIFSHLGISFYFWYSECYSIWTYIYLCIRLWSCNHIWEISFLEWLADGKLVVRVLRNDCSRLKITKNQIIKKSEINHSWVFTFFVFFCTGHINPPMFSSCLIVPLCLLGKFSHFL